MKVLYYQFYSFYRNKLRDGEPHLMSLLSISFVLSNFVNAILVICDASFNWDVVSKYTMFGTFIVVFGFCWVYFNYAEQGSQAVKSRSLLKSSRISAIITVLVTIASFILFFVAIISARE